MNFDITFKEACTKWKNWLAYERDTDTYDTCVFIDTDSTCGYLEKSDVICVFEDKTGDLVSFVERVEKKDFSKLQLWRIRRKGKKLTKDCPFGYEGFMWDRGEFIEFQFYKRWWYDIARDIGDLNVDNMHFNIDRG